MEFKSEAHRRWWFAVGRHQEGQENLLPSEQKKKDENKEAFKYDNHGLNDRHR